MLLKFIFMEIYGIFIGRMTDVLRELNFNYANLEKDLNRYLARLNFDQSEEVTNFHASSQVRPFWGPPRIIQFVKPLGKGGGVSNPRAELMGVPLINIQIESNETGRLLRRDVKVIKDEVVQCAVLIDSLTNQNQLHSEHQV